LTQLVEGAELTDKDRQDLRVLIDRLDRKRRGSGNRGREPGNVKGRAMEKLLTLGLVNAASATVLAILVAALGGCWPAGPPRCTVSGCW